MSTSSIAGVASGAASGSAGSIQSAEELSNQFMTLLVAQLKHQDPLEPMENEQFVSELAQLQSLDTQQKMASTNESLLLQSSLSAGASLIGREVRGNVLQQGQLTEITGVVQSLKVENGQVMYRVVTEDGLKDMSPSHLVEVTAASV
jgi:flagellar basal-body rod modification protein FlgD